MFELAAAFVAFLLMVLFLGLGLLTGRGAVEGSCGGLRRLTGDCAGNCKRVCPRRERRQDPPHRRQVKTQ